MELPNYFLADLPAETNLAPAMVTEACHTLKRNRERYLAQRSTQSLITLLCQIAQDWLKPEFPLRRRALEQVPPTLGFSRRTLELGLETFFRRWTPEAFESLIEQDLGHAQRLDQLSATQPEQQTNRSSIVTAPTFLVHITAGNLPCPALMSIALGMLTRSAQFVKTASGTALLPRLFAHSLYSVEPKLAACLEVAEWKGGNVALEDALFAEADCVTATGSDESLQQVCRRLPARTQFLGYGHRLSFAYITAEAFSGGNLGKLVAGATTDITAWNQLGCLSPHVIYVQEGGLVTAEKFAELLAEELARREETEPRGELPVAAAAAIAARRSLYEIRAACSPDAGAETRLWCSQGTTAWTVVYESDPQFQLSCLNRFIYVKPAKDLSAALQHAESVRGKVSTVGIAAPDHELRHMVLELARWGATRVCPLCQMQNPPLTWRHDGRPALADLVSWTDWEQP